MNRTGAGMTGIATLMLVALLASAATGARAGSKNEACRANLRELSSALHAYAARFGGESHYPTDRKPDGTGPGVSNGPNGAFWSHLWQIPKGAPKDGQANTRSVVKRPGQDRLFVCPVHGGNPGPLTLHYAGPRLANQTVFPGGLLTDRVQPDVYVAGDLIPAGNENHADEDYYGMRFDGSVHTIPKGSGTEEERYRAHTNAAKDGVRTP